MDKFLIGPINSGLQTNLVPFLLPEDAFTKLENMYIYKGRIIRRQIPKLLDTSDTKGISSRLKMEIGTTDAITGNFNGNAASIQNGTLEIGQQFIVGGVIFTIYQANGAMKTTAPAVTGTCNIATKTIIINNAVPSTKVYWFPATKVMGISSYNKQGDILEFAFDREFAYKYVPTDPNGPGWLAVTGKWTYSTTREYNTVNFFGGLGGDPTSTVLIVAKYTDPIKYYNSTTGSFIDLIPNYSITPNSSIRRAKNIIEFDGRLFLLNTVEYTGSAVERVFKNRMRYSETGNIFNVDSWYERPSKQDKGGYYDLPVNEEIKCAEILNNKLVIFCRDSIYELTPTGNKLNPYIIDLVDEKVGSKKDSVVKIDNNNILFVNNFGIYIYNGKTVVKIDIKIEDDFDSYEYRYGNIYNDIDNQLIYILVNNSTNNRNPNQAIVYNYNNNTFSNYFDNYAYIGSIDHASSGLSFSNTRTIIGTTKGYILRLDYNVKNGFSLYVANVHRLDVDNISLSIYNHNLKQNDYIRIENSSLNGLNGSYKVLEVIDDDTIKIANNTVVIVDESTYVGDADVLLIDYKLIETKQFNPYMKQGFGLSINKITFNLSRTTINNKVAITMKPNGSTIQNAIFDSDLGNSTLDTIGYDNIELTQSRVWHSIYLPVTAESISILITSTDDIQLDENYPFQSFVVNAILLHTTPAKYI